MHYVKLGSSDIDVSVVCLGTMTWGQQNTQEEAWAQLDYFVAQGGNFIDTAELYPVPPSPDTCGRTEEYIGAWLEARGNRSSVVLATKVMGGGGDTRNFIPANRSVPPNPAAPNGRLEPQQIHDAVTASLRRLRTGYLDLLQLHWPDRYVPAWGRNQFDHKKAASFEPVPFEAQLGALKDLLAAGTIRAWGVSNETAWGVAKLCEVAARMGMPPPLSIQNDFSLLDRRFEGALAESCYHGNLGLLVYGGLNGGALTDKYHDGSTPAPSSRHVLFPGFQPRYHSPTAMAAAKLYYDLAKSKGLSLPTLALAWCRSRWYVASTIIGATTMQQLRENMAAFEVALDDTTLAEIDAIHLKARNPNVSD